MMTILVSDDDDGDDGDDDDGDGNDDGDDDEVLPVYNKCVWASNVALCLLHNYRKEERAEA